MLLLGALLVVVGAVVAPRAFLEMFRGNRPRDVAASVVAVFAVTAVMLGAALLVSG